MENTIMNISLCKSIYLRSNRLGFKLAPSWPPINVIDEYYIDNDLYILCNKTTFGIFSHYNNRLFRLV